MAIIDFINVKSIDFNKNRIPSDYTEVAYIKSILPGGRGTSSLYVDTQVSGINGCRVRGSIDSTDIDHSLYGARGWWTSNRFGFTMDSHIANTFCFMHGSGEGTGAVLRFNADTNVHFIDDNCSKIGYCLIDNRDPLKIDYPNDVSYRTLWLFNDNCAAGGDYNGACTIYTAEFYKNQILVCYPVPCTRNSDSKAGFYDIVNNRFLTETVRKGTAYLQAGPVVDKDIIKISDINGNVLWQRNLTTNPVVTPHIDDPGHVEYESFDDLLD